MHGLANLKFLNNMIVCCY